MGRADGRGTGASGMHHLFKCRKMFQPSFLFLLMSGSVLLFPFPFKFKRAEPVFPQNLAPFIRTDTGGRGVGRGGGGAEV